MTNLPPDQSGPSEDPGSDAPSQPPAPPQPPTYAPPVYAPPTNQPPTYAPGANQPPAYQPPQHQAPQYQAPQYQPHPQQYYAAPAQVPHVPLPTPGPGEPFDGAYSAAERNRPLYGASFGSAFTRFFQNYANFTGRASRSEYWWMVLIYFAAFLALGIVIGLLEEATYSVGFVAESFSVVVALALIAVFIGSIVPWLALTWRRLHDVNLPGPFYFITLVPYVGGLVLLILHILGPKPEGRRFDRLER